MAPRKEIYPNLEPMRVWDIEFQGAGCDGGQHFACGHRQVTGRERPYRGRSDEVGLIFTGDFGAILKHGWSGTHGSVVGK